MRRCLVGQTSGPASSPSASRLVEAVCIQLCRVCPSGTRVSSARRSRWPGDDSSGKGGGNSGSSTGCGSTGVCVQTATGAFTACPLSCCPGRTTNSCCSSCNGTFCSYTASPPGPLTAPAECEGAPHPPPIPTLPRTTPAQHVLPLPLAAARHAGPQLPALQLLPGQQGQQAVQAAPPAPPPQPLSTYKTEWLRRKKAEQRAAAPPGTGVSARAGVPQVQKCRKCGQPKRRETGHTRYGSGHFCSAAAGKSVEDWLREMKERDQGRDPD
ncbi:uncharacterized protein LOC127360565 [Dicentrarchus labrax]|uniref:uncharacterized protein LOC127360565 n=1 Tax=Dicentrarchus labrax TaxID=13489 RepID=UPI0021F56309|nr:uncharacterized protein LOC127360565 [Dicentrarchus labrax]XP_051250939.1 uncharacterized protein LOC127360565 [Dicentrarchus labrax]